LCLRKGASRVKNAMKLERKSRIYRTRIHEMTTPLNTGGPTKNRALCKRPVTSILKRAKLNFCESRLRFREKESHSTREGERKPQLY
jgi:hypothetical protein